MPAQRSIVIGGGAFAGLALALALRQGLGPDIPVIVADPALAQRPSRDPRATAIVAASRPLLPRSRGRPGGWRNARAAIHGRPRSSRPAAGCSKPSGYGIRSPPERNR